MNIICSICARGGSQGVKNKNLKLIAGKPLIAHTIEQAKATNLFKDIVVSSDSPEILSTAKKFGATLLIGRPMEMATSTAAKLPAIQHNVIEAEKILNKSFDIIVDLDVTSPLRLPKDIVGSVEKLKNSKAENLITVSSSRRSPYFNMVEETEDGYVHLSKKLKNTVVRRQDAPRTYDMNASIYCWKRASFLNAVKVITEKTIMFEMPEERSHDIDTEFDFTIVKFILEGRLNFG